MKPRDADPASFEGLEPPNHTQVPNALFDDLMCQMKEAELRVTLAICRYTFGWHKKEDEISLTRLQSMTGLSRQGVIQGIEAGMQRGVIRRRPRGQSFMYRLRLVNVVDQLPATNGTGPAIAPRLVNVVDQPTVSASQLSRPVDVPASQLSRPELVNYVDTQKKGKKESESPPPTMREPEKNGGGDGDFFRELRRRGVGAKKAREIAAMDIEPYRILRFIDSRPPACTPDSPAFGRLINDIIDGVAGDYARPAAHASPPLTATLPNLPDNPISPAEMLQKIRGQRESP